MPFHRLSLERILIHVIVNLAVEMRITFSLITTGLSNYLARLLGKTEPVLAVKKKKRPLCSTSQTTERLEIKVAEKNRKRF